MAADNNSLKPGSSEEDAKKVGGEGDFGAAVNGRRGERDYVSRNTKASDPGAAQPWDWEHDGRRDHGAGARDAGPGSASGGDLDPDIVGVGTGGSGIATSGVIGRPPGPDDSDGSSNEFASGGPAQGRSPSTTHSADLDASTSGDAQGADAATDAKARDDDSFAGEISTGEARGQDN